MFTAQQPAAPAIETITSDGVTAYIANGRLVAFVGGPAPVGRTFLNLIDADGEGHPQLCVVARNAHLKARAHAEAL